jgi:hypothetical protein
VRACFVDSEKIMEHSNSYSDGEFVKECLVAAVDILYPNNSNNVNAIRLSRRTMTRGIDKLADDLEQGLRNRTSKFGAFSLATD